MRPYAVLAVALTVTAVASGCATSEVASAGASAAVEWSAVAEAPLSERHGAAAAWVGDRFVVVGGDDGPPCPPNADCVVPSGTLVRDGAAFDPESGAWTPIAEAPAVVLSAEPAVIGDVLYLVAGGVAGAPPAFLSYDSTADTWTTLPSPPDGPGRLVAAEDVLLSVPTSDENGPVRDWWFDPGTATWHRLADDPLGPSFDRAVVVVGDRIILTAKDLVPNPGADGPSLVRMAELDPTMTHWTVLPDSEIVGSDPVAAGGRLVFPDPGGADGGEVGTWGRTYPYGGIYDPGTRTWAPLPETSGDDSWPRLVVGDLVRVGDSLLDPVALTTTAIPDEPWGPEDSVSVVGSSTTVFAWGRTPQGTAGWLYTP